MPKAKVVAEHLAEIISKQDNDIIGTEYADA
jgi:hypothetical protein